MVEVRVANSDLAEWRVKAPDKISDHAVERQFALFEVRARTRQNPLLRAELADLGITPESTSTDLTSGAITGAVCTSEGQVVGFCSGAFATGEILVLAVLPDYEGRGAGTRLLERVVSRLRDAGAQRLWLAAAADPAVRAHGFYRALGWRPTGERTALSKTQQSALAFPGCSPFSSRARSKVRRYEPTHGIDVH
jgi:ribosomal protein S18 acetylase RimI-like enzyme